MPTFSYTDLFKLAAAFFTALGGATVVIIALAKFFGDFLSKRLLDNYNNKHENELEAIKGTNSSILEGIKNKYTKELEETKTALDKAKSLFFRYSEKQFDLYNELWKVLLYTKNQADSLWQKATPEKIPSFSEQIKLTNDAVNDGMLLIEEDHFNKLIQLIKEFEQFQFGKVRLIELRGLSAEEIQQKNILQDEVDYTIDVNRQVKEKYDSLIMEIGKSFRNQIKG
ncbi:MAG TPA: hypothetical protein VG738_02220 [Chitinophagaceae bacterium]|nr:hypothetical protein [Chitinophagaceae bacterium]